MSNSPSQSNRPDPVIPEPDTPPRKYLEPEILEPEILDPHRQTPQSHGQPPHYAPSGKRFPWGCLIGGCLTMVVLMVGGLVAVGFGSVWFYKQQLAQYTSEEARPLPVVEVSPEELQQLESRVEAFQEKVEQGETPEQLILNADDVNALISKDEKLRGKVFVIIEDGLVQADVSLPTNGIPGGQGRYFNGSVSVNASLEDGVLIVTLQDAEVNGQPVPETLMRAMRKENLAKDIYKDPEVAEKLRKFESLVIEGDRIILTPKPDIPEMHPSLKLDPAESGSARQDKPPTAIDPPAPLPPDSTPPSNIKGV